MEVSWAARWPAPAAAVVCGDITVTLPSLAARTYTIVLTDGQYIANAVFDNGTLGILIMVAVLAAVVLPNQAQAVFATLVKVVNISANPVPIVMSGTPLEAALCHALRATQGALCGAQASDFVVPSTTSTGASEWKFRTG
jgi:hypothetical protein